LGADSGAATAESAEPATLSVDLEQVGAEPLDRLLHRL
jgi:hypothetical protein